MADPDAADGVLQALAAARRLHHPNIVGIAELLADEGAIFVVCELVVGANLTTVLRAAGPLPLEPALHIGLQICVALEHAHGLSEPVLHGALWPSNVLLSAAGDVKLSDFGASAAGTHPRGGEVSVRTRCGYFSPEQLAAGPQTPRTDIYGLGVLLYEMITGRPPFLGETAMQTVERVMEGTPVLDGIPWRLADALRRALALDPLARYPTAGAMAEDLRRIAPDAASTDVKSAIAALVAEAAQDAAQGPPAPTNGGPAALPGTSPDDEPTNVGELVDIAALSAAAEDPPAAPAFDERPPAEAGPDDEPTTVDEGLADRITAADIDVGPTLVTAPLRLDAPVPAPIREQHASAELTDVETVPSAEDDELSQLHTDPRRAPEEDALFGAPSAEHRTDPGTETDTRSGTLVAKPGATPRGTLGPAGSPPLDVLARLHAATPGSPDAAAPLPRTPVASTDDPWPPAGSSHDRPGDRAAAPPGSMLARSSGGSPQDPSRDETPARHEANADEPWSLTASSRHRSADRAPAGHAAAALDASTLDEAPPSRSPGGGAPVHPGEGAVRQRAEERAPLAEAPLDVTPAPLGPLPQGTGVSGVSFSASYSSISEPTGESLSGFSGSLSGISLTGATFDPEQGTPLYDGESISRSLDPPPARPIRPRKRPRSVTSAHALLIVAILAFAFAVGLLIRRLLREPRQAPAVTVVPDATADAVPDAAAPDTTAPDARSADVGVQDSALPPDATPAAADTTRPPPQRRTLRVQSSPRAAVYIDGRPRGETPVQVPIPPDARRLAVVLVAPGHAVYRREVDVSRSGGHRLRVQLQQTGYPRTGSRRRAVLHVRCVEGDIRRVLINGKDSGLSCPKATFLLWPGRYRVSFFDFLRDNAKTIRLTLRARQTRALKLTRKP